jgi:hypothetical protein
LNLKGRLSYLSVNTKKSLYLVNTPGCLNLTTSTPCPNVAAAEMLSHVDTKKFHINGRESLRSFFPNLAKSANFQSSEYVDMFEGIRNSSSYEFQELATHRINQMLPFGTIYILTSPCQLAIWTAVDIADALNNDHIRAVVRVDDRISSSCFPTTADRIVVLQSMLAHLDTLEPYVGWPWKYVDRTWLDQKLYLLESDFTATGSYLRMSNTIDIFSKENYEDPFAGLIIVGEVDFCIPLLQAEPFPWTPRVPREYEIYETTCRGLEYHRKYTGRLAPRPPPTETDVTSSQRQASGAPNLDAESSEVQNDKRPASPLVSGSGKRALTQSMVSDGGSAASSS